jgi:hypothetical protein
MNSAFVPALNPAAPSKVAQDRKSLLSIERHGQGSLLNAADVQKLRMPRELGYWAFASLLRPTGMTCDSI